MTEGERLLVASTLWIGMAILGPIGYWRASREAKVRWYPGYIVFVSALFVVLAYWATRMSQSLYFAIPAAVLFAFLNIKLARFCSKCGSRNLVWSGAVRRCHKCGLELPSARQHES
jgi:hypothetical protein